MLKMSYAGCPGPSPAISTQFTLKMCRSRKSQKNPLKPVFWEFEVIQSHRCWHQKSLSLLLVMISGISVSICNRFHATRD